MLEFDSVRPPWCESNFPSFFQGRARGLELEMVSIVFCPRAINWSPSVECTRHAIPYPSTKTTLKTYAKLATRRTPESPDFFAKQATRRTPESPVLFTKLATRRTPESPVLFVKLSTTTCTRSLRL